MPKDMWFVKEFSQLTGVSVRTLHYYDKLVLLKPSMRQINGYRLYSETDLLKLQQILALKFFGFKITQIKALLTSDRGTLDHFRVQAQFLDEKVKTLLEANQVLKSIISDVKNNESIPWETLIQLIEGYRMTEQLEKTWAGKVFTPDELKQYAGFEAELKNKTASKKDFEKNWADVVLQVKANLHQDPKNDFGIAIAKYVMDLVGELYGKKHANLKHAIWEKGYKKGLMDEDHFLNSEIIEWLDKATDAYYRRRIYAILDQVESNSSDQVLKQWNTLLEEMYGDYQDLKRDLIEAAVRDEHVSAEAKRWLLSQS